MTERAGLSKVSDEQLMEELDRRGYVFSIWGKNDIIDFMNDDEDCAFLSDEQKKEVAQLAIKKMSRGIQSILGSTGFEYTSNRWFEDVKDEVLSGFKSATPSASS